MSTPNTLTSDMIILYAYIFAGFLIGIFLKDKKTYVRSKTTDVLINVISPLQIFTTLMTNTTPFGFWFVFQIVLVMLAVFTINTTSVLYYLKNKSWVSQAQKGSHFLNAGFPNVMFFTIPLILTLFSEELIVVSVFYAVSALVLRGSVGIIVCKKYGREPDEIKKTKWEMFLDILKSMFTFAPFLSILISMFLITLGYNQAIGEIMIPVKPYANKLASDVSLLLVGMVLASLKIPEVKIYWKHIRTSIIWRQLISFLVFISIIFFLDFGELYNSEVKAILLLIVVGPPAVFNVVFSIYFKLDEKFAAIAVATITLLVLIILPFILYLGEILF